MYLVSLATISKFWDGLHALQAPYLEFEYYFFLSLFFFFFWLFLTLSYVSWMVTQCHDQVAFLLLLEMK
jgi:hypothetical protein